MRDGFFYSGLLALSFTGTAFARRYQPTKDGKTRVWNENAKPGDTVTWSGARDAKGYAAGLWHAHLVYTAKSDAHGVEHSPRATLYRFQPGIGGNAARQIRGAAAGTQPKKKERTGISEQRPAAAHIEATPKKPQPIPAQEGHFTRADAIANFG